jgi:aspartate kinase
MKVYKFGGASIRDAGSIRNLSRIISDEPDDLVVVVSAFGKTTNALEEIFRAWLDREDRYLSLMEKIHDYHISVVEGLFPGKEDVKDKINISFAELKEYLSLEQRETYDYEYDQIVSYGEIWSTMIIAEYLKTLFKGIGWIDIRENLLTDDRYRDANIMWNESTNRIRGVFNFRDNRKYVTQGFIGGTVTGKTTTLGREGSDFTAAIIANILNAECVVVWKDVPGIMNADPKWLPDARKLDEITYKEAVEMTFSGAKVIHPKTIKPLHNKNIPLIVRSFFDTEDKGTVIRTVASVKKIIPVMIKKESQILVSILPKDFSFVMGDNLGRIFHSFMLHGIKVNLVQASAVSINVCVDDERVKIESLIDDLKTDFKTYYNENVEMLSVRHYSREAVRKVTDGYNILLEQRTRNTVRFVVRK